MSIPAADLAAITAEAPGSDGHRQVMRLAVNAVAAARGLPAPWTVDLPHDSARHITKRLADLNGLPHWGAHELGGLREQLLPGEDRRESGAWYTPPDAARPLARAALSEITDLNLDDDPAGVLAVTVLDPACGGGVFLIEAARLLATAYVALLYGTNRPARLTIQAVKADVMRSCIHGIDTDPVDVDLTKSALWLESGGVTPITWLDDNVFVGNALHGDCPPALAGRLNAPTPLAILGNPPYKDKAKGRAPWIEGRRPGPRQTRRHDELWRPSLDDFRLPGQGRTEYVLSNLYVFFWRWALWRAFETRLHAASIAFLTPSAWLTSPAFGGMRGAMRRAADQGLIIDLTPEGNQPPGPTRIFPGVSRPLCAALLSRRAGPQPDAIATVHHATVHGTYEEKVRQLERLLSPPTSPADHGAP
ncbi:N-6 DNA methylase [Streptomyces mauvecolor]|uniref:site-specific DNA-methyltransferase (adenine-specific) n=1 Tax=Streptomyces mauvecolor TaxID=58345 RepID=A0ABV9UGJ1_9ACTN